jgi:hypothetical protein
MSKTIEMNGEKVIVSVEDGEPKAEKYSPPIVDEVEERLQNFGEGVQVVETGVKYGHDAVVRVSTPRNMGGMSVEEWLGDGLKIKYLRAIERGEPYDNGDYVVPPVERALFDDETNSEDLLFFVTLE